ncbi:MAG TPA: tetratricopeptide repeat protein [Gemmatimonadales bacterium]|nr:tetratricopeptide repeat protein [Gemmatimonadales bacterium]
MNAQTASAFLLLSFGATAVNAQQPAINNRVAASLPSRYEPATCGIKPGHFKVSSGASYLKTSIETEVPENKARSLGNAQRVLLEAIRQNGQDKNPAAWYYLGRTYLRQGDLSRADSALTRAQALAPDCAKDIEGYRRAAWVALVNAGGKFEEQKNSDSALALFRQAGTIYHGSPRVYYGIATILNEKGQTDSAAYYFGQAASAGANATDTIDVQIRDRSAFNQAALLLNAKKYDEAAAAFERYLKWMPNDIEAKRGLAGAYRGAGKTEQAAALDKELVAAGGAPGTAGAPPSQDLMAAGVNFYNGKKYADAAAAFEKVIASEPYNRDALSNLSNTYLAMKNGPKLAETAAKLVAIEPLSENALKLLGEGHKQSGKVDQAVKAAEQVLALPADVKASNFATTANGATLTLSATGRAAQTPAGKAIPPAPVPITVEFLNATGGAVATQEAQIPALEAGASAEIPVTAQGSGITAWRYQRK